MRFESEYFGEIYAISNIGYESGTRKDLLRKEKKLSKSHATFL
jgi:hypothetical protein